MFCNFWVQRSHDLQSDRASLLSTIGELEKVGDGAEEKFFHSSDPNHEWRKTGGELDHFHFERRTIIQSAFDRPGVINLSSDMLVCFFSLRPATRWLGSVSINSSSVAPADAISPNVNRIWLQRRGDRSRRIQFGNFLRVPNSRETRAGNLLFDGLPAPISSSLSSLLLFPLLSIHIRWDDEENSKFQRFIVKSIYSISFLNEWFMWFETKTPWTRAGWLDSLEEICVSFVGLEIILEMILFNTFLHFSRSFCGWKWNIARLQIREEITAAAFWDESLFGTETLLIYFHCI